MSDAIETSLLNRRKTAHGDLDQRSATRAYKLIRLYRILRAEERSVDAIQRLLDCSRRSVYLLLDELTTRGVVVARLSRPGAPHKYKILP